jgi:Leucine-rich repeat (LRR) protein
MMMSAFYLFVLVSLLISATGSATSFSASEYSALQDFYNSTNGVDWIWETPYEVYGVPWNFSGPSSKNPCLENWQGVNCSIVGNTTNSSIYSISLAGHNLMGQLSSSLKNLSSLRYLILDNNFLTGPIPQSFALLKYLQILRISFNVLTGRIPSGLGTNSMLQDLDLSDNQLSGEIPVQIGSWVHLRQLSLSQNKQINGCLPESLGKLYNLTSFMAADCSIAGKLPASLGNWSKLVVFDIAHNKFSGSVPSSFMNWQFLEEFVVRDNALSGSFPSFVTQLSRLKVLDIANNNFKSVLPISGWENLSELEYFNVYANQLYGQIPAGIFTELTSLFELALAENFFSHTLPSSGFQGYSQIANVIVYSNLLTGILSNWLFSPPSLAFLEFDNNGFHGTIPDVFSNSSQLVGLVGDYNFLTGSIPSSTNNLGLLQQLTLSFNELGGTLSHNFVYNRDLVEVNFQTNYIAGSIPHNIGNWTSLCLINLGVNHFNGTIPSTVLNGGNLDTVNLYVNHLEGKIEDWSFGAVPLAIEIALYDNLLTGSIPESIGGAAMLNSLLLFENFFTGTMPKALSNMSEMYQFSVAHNTLHGNVSYFLSNMKAVTQMDLSHNCFSGELQIKPCLSPSDKVEVLNICCNQLTGTIPDNMYNQTELHLLFINSNYLHGTLTSDFQALSSMQYMNFSSNFFEGFPDTFINPQGVYGYIDIASNYFSGSINNAFNQLRYLYALVVASNFFTGSINSILNPSLQPNVLKLDVSGNSLSGHIPGLLFQMPQFQSLIADTNCFTGSIPVEICSANNLSSLVLDGLHASIFCNRKLFPWQKGTLIYTLGAGTNVPGIPECLFNLPNLHLFHISGNGIQGKLNGRLQIGSAMKILDLSHNSLSGTIPAAIFSHSFQSLDLSFNQFNGTISKNIVVPMLSNASGTNNTADTSLRLLVNRLSGDIPASLLGLKNINILEGNMFTCNGDESLLPLHDPKRSSYECGSDSTNSVLIAWVASVLGVVLIVTIIIRYYFATSWTNFRRHVDDTISFSASPIVNDLLLQDVVARQSTGGDEELRTSFSYVDVLNPMSRSDSTDLPSTSASGGIHFSSSHYISSSRSTISSLSTLVLSSLPQSVQDISSKTTITNHLHMFCLENRFLRKFLLMVSAYVCIVLLILYSSLKTDFGTFTHQYIWNVSFTFLKGVPPTVTIMMFVFILVVLMHAVVNSHVFLKKLTRRFVKLIGNADSTLNTTDLKNWKVRYLLLSIVFATNCIVVLVVNGVYVFAVSLSYPRNELQFISFMVSVFKLVWGNFVVLGIVEKLTVNLLSPTRHSLFLVILAILNNIVSPYAAEAFISPNCFEYALSAAPIFSSTISADSCFLFSPEEFIQNATIVCNKNVERVSLLINAVANSAETVSFNPPFSYSYQCSSILITVFGNVFIVRYLLSGIVQPVLVMMLKQMQLYYLQKYGVGSRSFGNVTRLLPVLWRPISPTSIQTTQQSVEQVLDLFQLTNDAIFFNLNKRLTIRKTFTVRMISDLTVLLTFGLLFPPLAVVLTFSMIVEITMLEYGIGRISQLAALDTRTQSQLHSVLRFLNDTFDGFGDGIWKFFPFLVVFCSIFWSFSFFDTLGDQVGATHVVWVFPIVICFPIIVETIILTTLKLYARALPVKILNSTSANSSTDDEICSSKQNEIEMATYAKA